MATVVPRTDRKAVAALRRLFADAGFTTDGIKELLQTGGDWQIGPRSVRTHVRRLQADESTLAALVRLFLLSVPAEPAATERALGDGLRHLAELGLVEEADGELRARVRIAPCDDLLIASDLPGPEPDHVAGVHPPSATLSSLTVRRPGERALDIGTGNGIQALSLARHAGRVVATDVNERALAFAELNAALNGIENVEVRAGSFLEPVAGERFGVAVANPPYVISPETEFVFRDSGLGRDRVSAELVRAFPSVLEEGGYGTVMISWIKEGDDAAAAPRGWVERRGCDAWLFHTALEDPLASASAWSRDVDLDELDDRLDRWLDYFRRERIEAIAYGTLVLRRRDSDNWFHSAELSYRDREPGGGHVELLFRAQDALARAGDLLDRRVAPAAHTVFEHANRGGPGGWVTAEAALAIRGGLPFRADLDGDSAALVAALRPDRTLREVFAAVAPTRGMASEEFTPTALELVRRMVALGFLELD